MSPEIPLNVLHRSSSNGLPIRLSQSHLKPSLRTRCQALSQVPIFIYRRNGRDLWPRPRSQLRVIQSVGLIPTMVGNSPRNHILTSPPSFTSPFIVIRAKPREHAPIQRKISREPLQRPSSLRPRSITRGRIRALIRQLCDIPFCSKPHSDKWRHRVNQADCPKFLYVDDCLGWNVSKDYAPLFCGMDSNSFYTLES